MTSMSVVQAWQRQQAHWWFGRRKGSLVPDSVSTGSGWEQQSSILLRSIAIYIIYIHIHNYIMHIITNSILHFTYIYYYTEYMCYTRILPSTLEFDGPQNSPSLARSVASPKSMNFCPVTPWWLLEWWAMLAPSLASTAKVSRSFGCRRRTTRASRTSRVPLWWVCLDNRLGTEPLG